MVVDHADDVRGDPALVALVEAFEGEVVPGASRGDEGLI
jgi:hypothetical protein